MKTVIKNWREAATLIVLSKRDSIPAGPTTTSQCNYDLLLQTRTERASFGSSAVFPGGVIEPSDGSPEWVTLLEAFGFGSRDFAALHCAGPVTSIFQDNPVQRHLTLRVAAIRETFEELGVLICSRKHKGDRSGIWAGVISDCEIREWQERISKKPGELLTLCKELGCYPDVWSLHYLSNWLSPVFIPKRFDTAFFVTSLQRRPDYLQESKEVAKVEWTTPSEVLSRSITKEVLLYPPQCYELNRLARYPDVEQLTALLKERSCHGSDVYYHAIVRCADGKLLVLPGDDLYPTTIDLNTLSISDSDKTVLQLRESSKRIHRFELQDSQSHLVVKNFRPNNMDMGDKPIEIHVTLSK